MRQALTGLVLLICAMAVPAIARAAAPVPAADDVEMILWEHQNWETNGGFERLTLWHDGRSEIVVAPLRYAHDDQEYLRPNSGWERVSYPSPPHIEFVRNNPYPPEVVRGKFSAALAAGIRLLKPFQAEYLDGSGTRVVIQAGGRQQEIVIPRFADRDRGTPNHTRFLAVAKILGQFDRAAYQVVGE